MEQSQARTIAALNSRTLPADHANHAEKSEILRALRDLRGKAEEPPDDEGERLLQAFEDLGLVENAVPVWEMDLFHCAFPGPIDA